MKDLKQLAAQCECDLRSIGIEPGVVARWQVNTRAKHRWGQCKLLSPGVYEISIAACLLTDDVDEQAVKDTIMHELLHTVEGANGHTGHWKTLAALVNTRLPSYTIRRTTDAADKGVTLPPARYAVQCTKCGKEHVRDRLTKMVRCPSRYRCSCGGTLKRIR